MATIVTKRALNPTVSLVELTAPRLAQKARPGQFVILRVDEVGERIPLTIADFDPVRGTVTLMYQRVGRTTQKLDALRAGEEVLDLVGPLGNPTEVEGARRVAVIGGGVGCAIAYPQAKALHAAGVEVDVIVGFRSRELVFLEEEFRAVCDHLYLTTDDGSYGQKGFVTQVLRERLEAGIHYDLVIAIGPIPMMAAVCEVTREPFVKTIVSLNPIMVDGTGMCGCCRVTVNGETKFACVDGPDFEGHGVDFQNLAARNAVYKAQEQEAREKHDHPCNMDKLAKEGEHHG